MAKYKLSNSEAFAKKVEDVVELCPNPTEHAMVLSIDDRSQSRP